MKLHYFLLAALLLANNLTAQIAGTTTVFGPVAPPATNSAFGGATSRYLTGGYQEWFPTTGLWTNRSYLPLGRMSLGMLVSAQDNPTAVYQLTDLSPETWTLFGGGSDKIDRVGGTFLNLNGTNLYLPSELPNRAAILDGSRGIVASTVTTTQLQGFDGRITTLESGNKGPYTVNSPTSSTLNNNVVGFNNLVAASAASKVIMRSSSGPGNFLEGSIGYGLIANGSSLEINPSVVSTNGSAFVSVPTFADLVTAVASPNHAPVYWVDEYYSGTGQGGGFWYWIPNGLENCDYPPNTGVLVSGRGGRVFPYLLNQKLDITRFGAYTYATTNITDPAVVSAWSMSQDLTIGMPLRVPIGYYLIHNTLRRKAIGTGNLSQVNGARTTGATNIVLDNVTGTFLPGDTIGFSTSSGSMGELEPQYRVIAYSAPNLQIAVPGLKENIADNEYVWIWQAPNMVIEGDNHGIQQDSGQRNQMTSTLMMVQDNVPILEVGGFHGKISWLNLAYDNFQPPANTAAACIYNPPDQNLYQYVFDHISCIRGAYGFHIAPNVGPLRTSPNNIFNNIIVRSASIQGMGMYKSGTDNGIHDWYIQNNGFSSSGINHIQSFTNAWKTTPGTNLALAFPVLPGMVAQGSYGNLTLSGVTGAYIVKQVSNNFLFMDTVAGLSATPLGATTGSFETQAKTQTSLPMVYFAPGFQFSADALDIELNIGSATTGVPVAWDNQGNGFVGSLHLEYFSVRGADQAIVRNSGGALNIGNAFVVNSGRLESVSTTLFENNTQDLGPSGTKGAIIIGNLTLRDLSNMTTNGNTWIISSNKNSTAAVLIGNYLKGTSIRSNTQSAWPVGTSVTYSTVVLPP